MSGGGAGEARKTAFSETRRVANAATIELVAVKVSGVAGAKVTVVPPPVIVTVTVAVLSTGCVANRTV